MSERIKPNVIRRRTFLKAMSLASVSPVLDSSWARQMLRSDLPSSTDSSDIGTEERIRSVHILGYGPHSAYSQAGLRAIVEAAEVSGANYACLTPFQMYYSNNDWNLGDSADVFYTAEVPESTTEWYPDQDLIGLIDFSKRIGLKVFLKPMLDPLTEDSNPGGLIRSHFDPGLAQIAGVDFDRNSDLVTLSGGGSFPRSVSAGMAMIDLTGEAKYLQGSTTIVGVASDRSALRISPLPVMTSPAGMTIGIELGRPALEKYFAAYSDFITHYAELARLADVELFSVGCELNNTIYGVTGVDYLNSYWTNPDGIIPKVRSSYDGVITYSSTGGEPYDLWESVDIVGVDFYPTLLPNGGNSIPQAGSRTLQLVGSDAYPELLAIGDSVGGYGIAPGSRIESIGAARTTIVMSKPALKSAPSGVTVMFGTTDVARLARLLPPYIEESLALVAKQIGKPVLVTECGFANRQGSAFGGGAYLAGPGPDQHEQAAALQALVQVLEHGGWPWFRGMSIWSWFAPDDPINWTVWRHYADRVILHQLWKLNHEGTDHLLAPTTIPVVPNATPTSVRTLSSAEGKAIDAAPGDILLVTTGAVDVVVNLPCIAWEGTAIRIVKQDSGSGVLVVRSPYIRGPFTSGQPGYEGHDLVIGQPSIRLIDSGDSVTVESDGSDWVQYGSIPKNSG